MISLIKNIFRTNNSEYNKATMNYVADLQVVGGMFVNTWSNGNISIIDNKGNEAHYVGTFTVSRALNDFDKRYNK